MTEYLLTALLNYEISEFLPLASLSCRIISNHHKAWGWKYSILLCCQLFISVSAYTKRVPTLSQLAESGLITTWQAHPPLCTKGRCHFINLLWPHCLETVFLKCKKGEEKKKKRKKSCHYRRYIIRTSGCFSPAIFHRPPPHRPPSEFCWRASERGSEVQRRRTRGHNQGWWFHWIFIIRQGWSPAGHYLIIALERTVKISLLQDFICLHGAIHVSRVSIVYVTI